MKAATSWPRLAAVILAGGAGSRVGGRDKPMLAVGGVPMLDRVLLAVEGAGRRIVVGPARGGLADDVVVVREDPPGGGPAAAVVAGLRHLQRTGFAAAGYSNASAEPSGPSRPFGADHDEALVALFAADLPYLDASAVRVLVEAVDAGAGADGASADGASLADGALFVDGASLADGALFVDERGRRQLLCGVWRFEALLRAVARLGEPAGRSVRALLDGLTVVEVRWGGERPPYFDCDTEDDLRRAEQR